MNYEFLNYMFCFSAQIHSINSNREVSTSILAFAPLPPEKKLLKNNNSNNSISKIKSKKQNWRIN